MADALAIILTEAPGPRFDAAMELALTWNALDRPVGVLLKEGALRGLAGPPADLLGQALADGVRVHVCQTSLDALGLAFNHPPLPDGVQAMGLVGFLLELPGAQVVIA
jgi:hypothetical protein